MSRGQNTIKRSEASTAPILLKYSASYDSSSFSVNGITVNRAINSSYNTDGVQFLNYALVRQLYYQEFVTGSMLFSSSYWNPSIQSTAALGTFDNDYRYFPTSSSAQVTVIGIPRTSFGEQLARKSLLITGSTYRLIDDGNGNVIDTYTTGSQPSTNVAYGSSGVRLYYPGYTINGIGGNLEWNAAYVGGSYIGTFWTNPVTANKTGRLNYSGLWSAKSLTYFGDFAIQFNITVTAGTYYFGIGCDNYGSVYINDNLAVSLGIPDGNGTNFRYWHIYPINLTTGTHNIKYVVTNAGIPDPLNPGAMGIEVYNNTQTQISASITAEPLGSSIPGGLNVIYSSKDYLSNTIYTQNNHVGNVLYSQGVIVITDEEYQNAMIPIPGTTTTTTSTTSTTTTAVPTTTTTTTVAPTTTTTTSTTTSTTTAPTTTTSTTTSTTTEPTTTTSTTTTTTTVATTLNIYARDIGVGINATPTLTYTVNGGSSITLGSIGSSACNLLFSVSGLSSGDNLIFTTNQTYAMSGATGDSVCPGVGGAGTYSYTMTSGINAVSISVNRDTIV